MLGSRRRDERLLKRFLGKVKAPHINVPLRELGRRNSKGMPRLLVHYPSGTKRRSGTMVMENGISCQGQTTGKHKVPEFRSTKTSFPTMSGSLLRL